MRDEGPGCRDKGNKTMTPKLDTAGSMTEKTEETEQTGQTVLSFDNKREIY
jgi:hypothetical protein